MDTRGLQKLLCLRDSKVCFETGDEHVEIVFFALSPHSDASWETLFLSGQTENKEQHAEVWLTVGSAGDEKKVLVAVLDEEKNVLSSEQKICLVPHTRIAVSVSGTSNVQIVLVKKKECATTTKFSVLSKESPCEILQGASDFRFVRRRADARGKDAKQKCSTVVWSPESIGRGVYGGTAVLRLGGSMLDAGVLPCWMHEASLAGTFLHLCGDGAVYVMWSGSALDAAGAGDCLRKEGS